SLDRRLLQKYGKATPEALAESALWEASLFEEHGFRDLKISVKHNDPVVMINAYRLLAERCDYPLHLGVTEAGPAFQGTVKSAVAAREADLGVASGNGKGQIFVKGEVIKTVPESKIVETLIEEAMKIAEQMEKDGAASGEPAVTVS
ncbi:flavodoxin-dependent (E)-4-hydroxy-3-methylbut-2-enyl-diphosphate synthase, partial [Streptomyces sp. NRRL S-37]|uniref:flavodoxin-dependent (E)-4-hydroxy-3-methylbut-2-enyl-diphosphate synthase n=1 Tax=Streptomyces sp. NRRL S-37 TaxID=1463903 RepID=UPI0004CAE8B5